MHVAGHSLVPALITSYNGQDGVRSRPRVQGGEEMVKTRCRTPGTKAAAVLRLLRGEDLKAVAREAPIARPRPWYAAL